MLFVGQLGINLHECVFQKFQFEIFEKLTSVNLSQIELEKLYDYLLIIYTKNFTGKLNDPKYLGPIIF